MRVFKSFVFLKFRKVFIIVLTVLLISVLMSQLLLTVPDSRVLLSQTDRYESVFVNSETNGASLGEMVLKISDCNDISKVRVLKNGNPIAVFHDTEITVSVSDNSLIEIDGTKLAKPFFVELIALSDEIERENVADKIKVNSNICVMGRILFK